MITVMKSSEALCRWSHGAHRASRLAMASAALAALLLAGGVPAAIAQVPDPSADQVYANCVLNSNGQGANTIDTLAGLAGDILDNNPGGNAIRIQDPPDIAYVIVYAIDNDNNGQALVDKFGAPTGQFTGPVICVAPGVNIDTALQTDPIPGVDILDLQDALILRHAPAGAGSPGANRTCHTTDGTTDCFDID